MASITMEIDESDRQPDLRGNAQGPLQSASDFLGRTPSAGAGAPASQREVLRGRQERDLEEWAKRRECWLDPAGLLDDFEPGGEEHRIQRGERFYLKATLGPTASP